MKEELSFNEQVNYALILNELKKLEPEQREELLDAVSSDLDSYDTYLTMNKIAELIDRFLNEADSIMEIEPEYIEELISNLPDYHLMHIQDESLTKIYNNYCSKLYEFMLYENIKGRKKLFNKYEVKSIVVNEAIAELRNMELQEDMPHEIYSIIYNLRHNKNYTPNISNYVLNYLYDTRNNEVIDNYNKELDTEMNKQLALKAQLRDDLKDVKKKIRNRRFKIYKAIGIKFGIPIGLFGGMFGLTVSAPPVEFQKQNVTVETLESDAIESKISDSYLEKDILNKFMNTDRTLVTVFGDTNGEKVDVKVYDYTFAGFSNEQLQTIELDDSKMIYSDSVDINKIASTKTGVSHVYGKYTGVAHRDISNVSFIDSFKDEKGELIAAGIVFGIIAAALAWLITLFVTDQEIVDVRYDIEDALIDIDRFKRNRKAGIDEYEKVVNKIKAIKKRLDIEKKKKEVLGQTTVEKELEDNRPVGFRI